MTLNQPALQLGLAAELLCQMTGYGGRGIQVLVRRSQVAQEIERAWRQLRGYRSLLMHRLHCVQTTRQ